MYQTEISDDSIVKTKVFFDTPSSSKTIYDLSIAEGNLWLVGDFGLASFSCNNQDWKTYFHEPVVPFISIEQIGDQLLAVSTDGTGLIFYDYFQNKKIAELRHQPEIISSLTSNYLNDVYLDRKKTLWISDWKKGLNYFHLDKPKVKTISLYELYGPPRYSSIRSLAEDKSGNIWCATYRRGLIVFNKVGGQRRYNGTAGLPKTNIHYLYCNPEGVMFVVTNEGIFWYNDQLDRFLLVKNSKVLDIEEPGITRQCSNGKLLFYYYRMYEIVNDSSGYGYKLTKSPLFQQLDGSFIDFWYQDRNGAFYFNVNDASTVMIHSDGKVDTLEGIKNLKACWEPQKGDTIWLATTYGLTKMSKSTLEYKVYDETNGLPNQYIYCVLPGVDGQLWLSSNKGIIRFDPDRETAHQLTAADGVQENEFNTNAWLKTSSQEIWLGNQDGLNIIPKDKIPLVEDFPKIQITRLLVNDEDWSDSLYIGEVNKLKFPFSENTLSFEFVALEYSDPKNNQLWHRLDGYDPDGQWLKDRKGIPGFERYSKIPPGNYTFQIMAANSDGVKTPNAHELGFTILKPFYLQWWFIVLVVSTIVAMAYGIYKYRLSQIRKELLLQQKTIESEMKALRAQMNPHFVFNCINSINAFILKNKTTIASEYLNNFSGLIRQILDISAQEKIPLEEEIEFLEAYLKAEQLRLKDKLNWKIVVDEAIDTFETEIPTMILQPIVENAIWHGISQKTSPGNILIYIKKDSETLKCILEDDGIGIKASEELKRKLNPKHRSKGESVTRERLSLYDQKNNTKSNWETQDLVDSNGKASGTRVILNIGLR